MRHLFLVNPVAGRQNAGDWLVPRIQAAAQALGVKAEIVATQYRGHAAELARACAAGGEPAVLYACGGDGTFNEILQAAVGCDTLAVGCVPCGSGNDYVRNFADRALFLDMEAQLAGSVRTIDVIETSCGYSAAICAAGLDAKVAYGIPKFRRIPLCGGSTAYTLSILQTVLGRLGCEVEITLDGETRSGPYMLMAICNGQRYGGGYCAAPLGKMDDGLLDVVLVKPVPRWKLPGLLAQYKTGAHLTPEGEVIPQFRPYMSYCRARSVALRVLGREPVIVTVDGECAPYTELWAKVRPHCLNILLPRGVPQEMPALSRQCELELG